MQKAWTIAWKDFRVVFRDPLALVLMLAAPLLLTLVISAAFGGSSGSSSPQKIPVAIVNLDDGQFSTVLVEAFQSADLADLLAPELVSDASSARAVVDSDQAAAAVIIPAGFSASILPPELAGGALPGSDRSMTEVEIYTNPSRPVGAGIIRSVADAVINHLSSNAASGEVIIRQLMETGRITPEDFTSALNLLPEHEDQPGEEKQRIELRLTAAERPDDPWENFDWLRYMAASMAILYLMFAMTASTRTILVEREGGTLPRMLVTPTTAASVLGGKLLGALLTGFAQMALLIVSSRLLFGTDWGDPLGVILLTICLVLAAIGWSMIPAAVAKTPGQANAIGTAMVLTFAALAGNFVPRLAMPVWLRQLSLISPNAWGLEGYNALLAGKTALDLAPTMLALLGMAVVTFSVAVVGFRRQYAQ